MHSPHFTGCSVATLGPNRYPNAHSKFKEQAAIARASEIASLKRDAKWDILTACNTAAGRAVGTEEG